MSFISKWFKVNHYEQIPTNSPHRQIYIWLISNDKKFAVVTKDGLNWQLPGGKPEKDEDYLTTISREILEEIGFKVNDKLIPKIQVFGYYSVKEVSEGGTLIDEFIQIRSKLILEQNSQSFTLYPQEIGSSDPIISAKFINKERIPKYIP